VDTDGTVAYVDFYTDSDFIARDWDEADGWSDGEYLFDENGMHSLWAVATDNQGKYSSSLVSLVHVIDPTQGSENPVGIINMKEKIVEASG